MPGGKLAKAAATIISCKSSAVGSEGGDSGCASSESCSDSGGGGGASLWGSGGCSAFSSDVSSLVSSACSEGHCVALGANTRRAANSKSSSSTVVRKFKAAWQQATRKAKMGMRKESMPKPCAVAHMANA